tara:strand:+ start:2966 stop:3784 length:819 start_codon:yes stop_codon:yes gene_type:complete
MRWGIIIVLLLWALPANAASNCNAKHEQMLYTVVLVEVSRGSGSGTVIHSAKREDAWESYVLTNFHVIEGNVRVSEEWDPKKGKKIEKERREEVKVAWFDYNDCSRQIGTRGKTAKIVAYDKLADLALLQITDTEHAVSPVAALLPEDDKIYLADEVWAVGAGLGNPPFMTSGHLAFQDEQIQGHRYMLATAPIIFGNSGGALFRLSEDRGTYELVGVPSKISAAGWQAITHMAWSIPIETIRGFLREQDYGHVLGDPYKEPEKDEEAEKDD